MKVTTVVVERCNGIHALVAHQLTNCARRYRSSLFIVAGATASLQDPLQLLALHIPAGQTVTLMADGPDEVPALEAVRSLLGPDP